MSSVLNILFSKNKRRWLAEVLDDSTSPIMKEAFETFMIQDNINIEKYIENQKANKGESNSNCTPTFRSHFISNRFNRAMGIPDWFYIGYPDVAQWMIENETIIDREILDKQRGSEGSVSINKILRLIIEKFRKDTGRKLECTN